MRPSSWGTAIAASFVLIVLVKDGTANKLVQDFARGAQDFLTGVRPIARVG